MFTAPEVMVRFKCDVHPWMASWVGVVAHPFFAVSDNAGKFDIKGLPPGTYTLEAWHEKYDTADDDGEDRRQAGSDGRRSRSRPTASDHQSASRASHSKLDDLLQLVKIRLNSLVVVTAAGGYYMAAPTVFDPMVLVATCMGTGLVAGGAAALNQVRERDIDQQMNRTKDRPVASGRMTSGEAIAIAGVADGSWASRCSGLWHR